LIYPAFAIKKERPSSSNSQGEILVGFKRGARSTEVEKVKRVHRLKYSRKIPKINVYQFKLPRGKKVRDVIKELEKERWVSFVETDDLIKIADTIPTDSRFGEQWGLNKIGAPQAWDLTTGGASNMIAVIDTGVSTVHPEISSKLVSGYDFVNGDSDASDDNGHGTAVAGIVAAVTNNATGIAGLDWKAKIMPVKVMDATGSGYESDVADGIIWAADNGAEIINLSIYSYSYSPTLHSAINYALEKGCFIVAAAGNDGTSTVPFPAAFPGVIGVGASNASDGVPSWSNYGSALDVIAPGEYILSITTLPAAYIYADGTSFSSPHVAGLASLLRAFTPTTTSAEIEYLIEKTASRTASSWDRYKGWGRIDAYSALVETTTSAYYDTDEPNDTVNQATSLGSSFSLAVNSFIGRNSDTDFYSYTPSVSGTMTVGLTNIPPNCDYDIYLYGPGSQGLWNEIVAYSNNSDQEDEEFSYSVVGGQTYYIEVSSYYGFDNQNSYRLFINDNTPPTDPTTFESTPTTGTWTNDNTIEISWSGASDDLSGVDGYSINWSQNTTETPDTILDTTKTQTSTTTPDGTWYFNLRTRDNAGNWTSTVHVGPFLIDTQEPTITSKSPTGSYVPTTTVISINFSEPVTSITTQSFYLKDSNGTTVTCTLTTSTASATLTPSFLTQDTTYTVYLTSGVKDWAGNSLPSTSWWFKTASEETPPFISITTPSPNSYVGGVLETRAYLDDIGRGGSAIEEAEFAVDTTSTTFSAIALDGSFDETTEVAVGTINTTNYSDGVHTIYWRGKDSYGSWTDWTSVDVYFDNSSPTDPTTFESTIV
jgi:subtilisin family serine protease